MRNATYPAHAACTCDVTCDGGDGRLGMPSFVLVCVLCFASPPGFASAPLLPRVDGLVPAVGLRVTLDGDSYERWTRGLPEFRLQEEIGTALAVSTLGALGFWRSRRFAADPSISANAASALALAMLGALQVGPKLVLERFRDARSGQLCQGITAGAGAALTVRVGSLTITPAIDAAVAVAADRCSPPGRLPAGVLASLVVHGAEN